MSQSGQRQLRSSSRVPSAAPSAAPATPRVRSRKATSKVGSNAGGSVAGRNEVDSRAQDSYGSRAPDNTATQQRHADTLQQIGSNFEGELGPSAPNAAPSVSSSRRARHRSPDPSEQLSVIQEAQAFDPSRNDLAGRDVDGATGLPTGANDLVDDQLQSDHQHVTHAIEPTYSPENVPNKWLAIFALVLLALACLAPLAYYGSMAAVKLSLTKQIEGRIDAIVANHDSLVHRLDVADITYHQQLDYLEHRLSEVTNDQQITAIETKYKIDWFDPSNDALTLQYLTSPEKMRQVGGWMGLFKKEVPMNSHPKIIGPFADVKKTWCAPSTEGKAQVAVILPKHIFPKVLVVEQAFTMEQTLDYATYPKQIELWARVDLDNPVRDYDFAPDPDEFQGKELAAAQALPDDFYLIGRWDYKLGANLAKQSFIIPIGVLTNAVAVRVNSNWGNAEQTCLHKLQLFGEDAKID